MRIAWIDLETTGLDEHADDIIEVGLIITDESLKVSKQAHFLVKPSPQAVERMDSSRDDFVRRVVGYNESEWLMAAEPESIIRLIAHLMDGCVLAGHCLDFEKRFLRVAFRRYGLDLDAVIMPTVEVDTFHAASMLRLRGELPGCSLSRLCAHLGVKRDRAHRAGHDIAATLECARRLIFGVREGYAKPMLQKAHISVDTAAAAQELERFEVIASRAVGQIVGEAFAAGLDTAQIEEELTAAVRALIVRHITMDFGKREVGDGAA